MLDLFRPGSGLTWRKLGLYIRGLPADASLWDSVRAAEEAAKIPATDLIREAAARYAYLED